jgi:hypothetical protein
MLDYSENVPNLDARMRYRVANGFITIDDMRQCVEIEPKITTLVGEIAVPRRLCVTNGGFLGVMPPAAQQGDLIYLLKGGAVPFVLRPVDGDAGKFEMIGECFVYGIMNGEALRKDSFHWEEVTIA